MSCLRSTCGPLDVSSGGRPDLPVQAPTVCAFPSCWGLSRLGACVSRSGRRPVCIYFQGQGLSWVSCKRHGPASVFFCVARCGFSCSAVPGARDPRWASSCPSSPCSAALSGSAPPSSLPQTPPWLRSVRGFTVTAGRPLLHPQADQDLRGARPDAHGGEPVRDARAAAHDGIPDNLQIPDRLTSYGLRTVDGSCNNLFPGREKFAAADVPFPRLTSSSVFRRRRAVGARLPGAGELVRTPRRRASSTTRSRATISNLIVDQTATNPAAIQAAGFPVRTQGNPAAHCAVRLHARRRARRRPRRAPRPARRCSSRTSRRTSACRRRTTRCSRSSASSSTTASTRRSRAAAPCSSRCRTTTRS